MRAVLISYDPDVRFRWSPMNGFDIADRLLDVAQDAVTLAVSASGLAKLVSALLKKPDAHTS
jgi:hypothetical protein